MPQTHATPARSTLWSLEVVRGRDVGRSFDLHGDEIVLGNGLNGAAGVDLREQEAGSPRRMAGRQAMIEARGADLVIRDLESPGGTFVNRQRLLGGQARKLQPGDEIQVGGVVLRVAASKGVSKQSTAVPPPLPSRPQPTVPSTAAAPGRLPEPYSIGGSIACRAWDDFLVVAAQRWTDLRAELASGRLADYLRRIQRPDLLPLTAADGTADEQLDRWLGRLPVSQSSAPELDVHPDKLEVRPSSGAMRHLLRITNVGYRLLRSTARVEPAGIRWVRIASPYDGNTFLTIEETELPIDVDVNEDSGRNPAAEIVIESNGGTHRIPVRIASPARPPETPDAPAGHSGRTISQLFRPAARALTNVRVPLRIAVGVVAAPAIRLLVVLASFIPIGAQAAPISEPRLPALAALCFGVGVIGGLRSGWRRNRNPVDAATTGVAAGLLGVMAAAVIYAVVRTVEGSLGAWSSSFVAQGLIWSAIGAAVAGLTCLFLPFREAAGGISR